MRLQKLDLPNGRKFRGNEFPIAFQLEEGGQASVSEKVKFLLETASSGKINEYLAKNGAVLLRGFGHVDPETLAKFIEAIGTNSNAEFFEQNGSTAQRTEVTSVLTTANEGSPSVRIHQHNEFSRFTVFPSTLFFVCTNNNSEGGETPIVHGGQFFESLYERFPAQTEELARRGLYFEQVWNLVSNNKTSWTDKFCFGRNLNKESEDLEQQKTKAEEIVRTKVSPEFAWDADDNLVVHQRTDPIRIYDGISGDDAYPVFFNSMATYYAVVKSNSWSSTTTKPLKFNDEEPIPQDFLEAVLQTSIDLAFNHTWQEGDIVIVNNLQVSHGRLPWKNGERKVLVSMWDHKSRCKFKVWKP